MRFLSFFGSLYVQFEFEFLVSILATCLHLHYYLISGLNIWIWIFVTWGVTKRCRSIQAEKEGEEILGAEYLSAIGA
ncbi:hypothetical protein, partial [Sulfurimonas sp.]|uniref:hypothetical protein n=1 Tax=Sulfurimonas sp. TaxID=2022749 RepID=UPI003D0D148C